MHAILCVFLATISNAWLMVVILRVAGKPLLSGSIKSEPHDSGYGPSSRDSGHPMHHHKAGGHLGGHQELAYHHHHHLFGLDSTQNYAMNVAMSKVMANS
jgi:hypothetical protein